jgi:hypothetical protein
MVLNLSDEGRILRNYDESLYIKMNKISVAEGHYCATNIQKMPCCEVPVSAAFVVKETKSYTDMSTAGPTSYILLQVKSGNPSRM